MSFIHIFNDNLNQYLDKLKPESPAKWGKMQAQHMIEHLGWTFPACTGKVEVPVFTAPEKLPARLAFLRGEDHFPQNFRSVVLGDDLPVLKFSNIGEAKQKLLKRIEEFRIYAKENPDAMHNHPVFGKIGMEDWLRFQNKHFTHHFNQFGLIN